MTTDSAFLVVCFVLLCRFRSSFCSISMKPIVLLCAHLGPHLSLAAPHISLAGLAGKPECPCISSSSSGFEQLQRDLAAVGLPQDYGTQGCQAYDRGANHGGIDCLDNAHDYCENKWCYVDADLCSRNREICLSKSAFSAF